jgi:hypothetical protein
VARWQHCELVRRHRQQELDSVARALDTARAVAAGHASQQLQLRQ